MGGLLLISIITLASLFSYLDKNISVYPYEDLTFHLNRTIELSKAFEEGQILPKIWPYGNNGYGYASPLFYCDLFLYPFAVLYHFNNKAIVTYKLCVFFYTFIGCLIIYYIVYKETKKKYLPYIAILLYLSSSYHLHNIFIRNALGEILAMTFIPLVLYAIYKVLVKHEECPLLLGISFSFLVMSHLISSLLYGLFFFVMIIVFVIINHKDKVLIIKTFKTIIKGTIIAILLTAWYLLPMFEQLHSQTFWLNINALYTNVSSTVQTFKDIIDINSYKNTGLCLLVLGFLSIFVKSNKYINIILSFCVFLYLILLGFIDANFLTVIQFYFRLYILIFPLLCVCSIYLLININNKVFKNIIQVLIILFFGFNIIKINLSTINYDLYKLANDASMDEINTINSDLFSLDYNHDELGGGEYIPYTEYIDYLNFSKKIKYLDNGSLIDYIDDYEKSFTTITFTCDNKKELEIILPVSYYKGYVAYELVNDNWQKVNISYSDLYKLLLIDSPEGIHTYKVSYKGTIVQYISLAVSAISSVFLFVYYFKKRKTI